MLIRRAALLLIVAILVPTVPGFSQAPAPNPSAASGAGPAARNPRAERIIEALLIWRLVDELQLTDQQIARIFPHIKALKDLRIELGREKLRLQRDLRALLQASPRDERAIEAKVAELEALRDQIERRRQGVLREIQSALTVEQRARFALIQETFEADTIRLLEEVRRAVEEQRRRR